MTKPKLTPKQVVRRYLKSITHGTAAELRQWAAPDIKATQGSQQSQGHDALEHYAMTYRKLIQDWRFELDRMISEGAWVSACGHSRGKRQGKAISIPVIAHYRVSRGKVAEVLIVADWPDETSKGFSKTFPLDPK